MKNRYVVSIGLLVIVGVVALWWFDPTLPSGPPSRIANLSIDGSANVNAWSCVRYSVQFPQTSTPSTAKVSSTLGGIYASDTCDVSAKQSSVLVDAGTRRATFYLHSDATGTATIAATAVGTGPLAAPFSGTKTIAISWPGTVPMCKWGSGWKTCKGECSGVQPFGGIRYTRIPYTNEWEGYGCCPKPPGAYYQAYGTDTCKKQ